MARARESATAIPALQDWQACMPAAHNRLVFNRVDPYGSSMSLEITKVSQSHDPANNLACSHLETRINDVTHHLPAICANYADYDHARKAGLGLRTDMFNYHHNLRDSQSLTDKSALNNIAKRIKLVQDIHKPSITSISLQHSGNLTDGALGEFHEFQGRLGLPIITTVEKNPLQGLDSFREELEQFDDFPTDSIRSPTITMRGDPEDFKDKLLHIVRNYRRFNLQWNGLKYFDRWQILSPILRDHDVWCNMIGITSKFERISVGPKQYALRSNIVPALVCGAHTHCFSWPASPPRFGHNGTTSKPFGRSKSSAKLFDPQTWCYDESQLDSHIAHVRSFNAIQDELDNVRASIDSGAFYSDYCAQKPALRATIGKIRKS